MLLRALKFTAGAALGIALWWNATPSYNHVLAVVAQPLLHIDTRFAGAVLEPLERTVRVTSSTTLPVVNIPAGDLTYNIILLLGLFATNDRPWRWANLRPLLLACAVVFVAHVAGLLISIESTYALRIGTWSREHYGSVAQDVWLALELFYRVVGMFGVAFGCWWAAATTRTTYRRMLPDRTE